MATMADWNGVLMLLDEWTGDGRLVEAGGFFLPTSPIPLLAVNPGGRNRYGHEGSFIIGRIDRAWLDGNLVRGEGSLGGPARGQVLASLPLKCGADLSRASWRETPDGRMSVHESGLAGVTAYLDGAMEPAWPQCRIEAGPYVD